MIPAGDPAFEAFLQPGPVVVARRERLDSGRQAFGHLGLVPADQDARHRRVSDRRWVATDRDARRIDRGVRLARLLRPR